MQRRESGVRGGPEGFGLLVLAFGLGCEIATLTVWVLGQSRPTAECERVKIPTPKMAKYANRGWGTQLGDQFGARLAGTAKGLGVMDRRDAGNGGDHHTREQLHGGYIPVIERAWSGRQNLEDAQGAAIVPEGRDQN